TSRRAGRAVRAPCRRGLQDGGVRGVRAPAPDRREGRVLRLYALALDRGLRALAQQPGVRPGSCPTRRAGTGRHRERPPRVRRRARGVRVTAVDPIARLTCPGGAFEIVVDDVVGHPTQVYKQRMRSLRELMAQNAARADLDWVVQEDRRFSYGEHDRISRVLA